jgi:hypothetical protein
MSALMQACDNCLRDTPAEYMIMLDDVHYLCNEGLVSDGVAAIARRNSRTDDAVDLCVFCLTVCQSCRKFFLTTEGAIICELDDHGFLTGGEIILCQQCIDTENMPPPDVDDGNAKPPPCLSNTTNSFKNGAFGRPDSESEAHE